MQSVMTNRFKAAGDIETQRSSFDRSFGHKTTFDGGWLIPIYVDEALPGDTFNLNMTGFARLATPIHPIMDNLTMETFFFAVPNRLLWSNWERFMGAKDNPGDTTEYTLPRVFLPLGTEPNQLADYFGLPPWSIGSAPAVSALPFRAYALIWNEWFRDQNLQDSIFFTDGDGPDQQLTPETSYVKHRRGKRHDYFTSCLPWPQKGPEVLLPTGPPLAPVYPTNGDNAFADPFIQQTNLLSNPEWIGGVAATSTLGVNLVADLNSAFTSTINELREAFQIQKLLERDARGGTRYTEIIKSHFGINSPDQRLQRPEYLGGGSSPVQITPIAQTSETGTSPQGNLSAMGTATLRGHGFTKSFTEHCTLIGLVNVRADLTYQKGLDRMWSRQTKLDYYWPSLAHLGEQAVLSKEIYSDGTANDEDIFGYQERYAEYRYKPSQITGAFRSDHPTSLDVWHLSEHFTARPVLGESFIRDSPPISRVVAVPTEPEFILDSYFKLQCSRPMPLYSIPGMIDHF